MTIKIEVKKFVNEKGNKMASITKIEGMKFKEELPDEYTQHEPCTWLEGDRIKETGNCISLYINSQYKYELIEAMIAQIRRCGEHLHTVNLKIKRDIAEWTKTEIYEI